MRPRSHPASHSRGHREEFRLPEDIASLLKAITIATPAFSWPGPAGGENRGGGEDG